MTKRKKQVLGLLGLAFVAAVTAVAYALPTEDAAAEGEAEVANNALNITVKVEDGAFVDPDDPSGGSSTMPYADIVEVGGVAAEDGMSVFDPSTAEVAYRRANSVSGTLTCGTGNAAKTFSAENKNLGYSSSAQTTTLSFDTAELGTTPAACKLEVVARNSDGKESVADVVEFQYRAASVSILDKTDPAGNPITKITFRSDVTKLQVMVYDAQSGKPVFVNANGVEEPIVVTLDSNALKAGFYELVLPMTKYGAKLGDYELTVIAYNAAGATVSLNTVDFKYPFDVPNVPGTGSILKDLNISRMDYILTGLIAFGAVAGFAVYLVVRRNRR